MVNSYATDIFGDDEYMAAEITDGFMFRVAQSSNMFTKTENGSVVSITSDNVSKGDVGDTCSTSCVVSENKSDNVVQILVPASTRHITLREV